MNKDSIYKEYLSDKKTIFTIFCLSIAFVLVILISFGVNLFFHPLVFSEFLINFAIFFALCVYCIFFGVFVG